MQVYNDELYHFGVKGMKWGRRKLDSFKKSRQDYKSKIDKIANSKSAHSSDVKIAKKANGSMPKKLLKSAVRNTATSVAMDLLTGNFGKGDIKSKIRDIGTSTLVDVAANEALARSVANKYNNAGRRVKGKNSSLFTREDVARKVIKAVPVITKLASYKLHNIAENKRKGRKEFEKWGGNILESKLPDYSNYVTNVNYKVK